MGEYVSETDTESDADADITLEHLQRTLRRNAAVSQNPPSPYLAVPPRTHHAPGRNRAVRPRAESTSSTTLQPDADQTDVNSDLSLSPYELNSSHAASTPASSGTTRMKREKHYDKSKTVPWVVSL